jgi:hypothetical protein
MSIDEYTFDKERLFRTGRLFPIAIEDDPWTLFHGTFDIFEKNIERDGLKPQQHKINDRWVHWITHAYTNFVTVKRKDRNSKAGIHGIYCYSLDEDGRGNPLYLTISSARAAGYAFPELCGGELASSLRIALTELVATAKSESNDQKATECREWFVDNFDWLKTAAKQIDAIPASCQYSVIYAIKFNEKSLSCLTHPANDEVCSNRTIHPSELRAKIIIPSEFYSEITRGDLPFSIGRERLKNKRKGVLGAIVRESSENS